MPSCVIRFGACIVCTAQIAGSSQPDQCRTKLTNSFRLIGTGKRVVTCHLTASSGTELKFIFAGNTWVFRDAMDEFGIKGRLESLAFVLLCVVRVCVQALSDDCTFAPKASIIPQKMRRKMKAKKAISACIPVIAPKMTSSTSSAT